MKKLIVALSLLASSAFAAPVNIVTTSGPGSLSDQAARYIQPLLAKELGEEVIVVNVPGASGLVGMRAFNQLPKNEGHVLLGSFALAFVAKTMPQPDFDPLTAFTPVVGMTHVPLSVTVPSTSPAKSVSDFVKMSAEKGGLRGGTSHPSTDISMMLLDKQLGMRTEPVAYKQTAQLYTDLAAGVIDYTIGGGNKVAVGLIESGKLRVLERINDFGIEDFSWTGLFMHAGAENSRVFEALKRVVTKSNMQDLKQPLFDADAATLRKLVAKEYALIPAPKK